MRVVIADDSPQTIDIWRAFLRSLGHEIVGVGTDGREAVALCSEHRPDIAMLDMSMGAYGGDQATVDIVRDGTARYVLVASSMTSSKDRLESLGASFIAKPIHNYKILGNAIEAMMKE